jgi:hypothetical protein
MRLKGDSLFAAALFGIFSFGTYHALVMNDPSGGPSDVGAAFFPFWVCVSVQILTAVIFFQSLSSQGNSVNNEVSAKNRILLLSSILLLLFIYIFIMDVAGFIISSILFLVLVHQLLVFFETGHISSMRGLAFSIVFFTIVSATLFFMFNTIFRLALP